MNPKSNRPLRVTVVTPVHNRRELTLRCVSSLRRLNLEGIELRIVVVDDGSSDGTSEALRSQYPDVVVLRGDGDLWFSEGTNVGIRRALEDPVDYVWQINNDEVFHEDALTALIRTAESHGRCAVGSLLLLWDTPHKVFQIAPVWDTFGGGWRHWNKQTIWTVPERPFEVGMIVGNSILVPANAYREVGLLDSRRFPLYGDAEFAVRLRRGGYRLLVDPQSRVFCEPNTPPPSLSRMGLGPALRQLTGDGRSRHSLRSRLGVLMSTGPTRMHGVIAFGAFLLRALLRRSYEGTWAENLPERDLKDFIEVAGRNPSAQ